MIADALATRMAVLTRALPSRILVVDDDEFAAELIAARLTRAGFEVARAQNGAEALKLLEQQWFPLVITDWQMPVMDGIEFTQALRARGAEDIYVIMLSMREASSDYERGYVAGVDDYLTKKVPDAELFARIHAAFNTLALRRSLREAQAALEQSVAIDAQSGAFAATELPAKLLGEIRRAQRYRRPLLLLTLGVQIRGAPTGEAQSLPAARPDVATPRMAESSTEGLIDDSDAHAQDRPAVAVPEILRGIVQTIGAGLRAHVDWIARLANTAQPTFALVLPEAGIAEAPALKQRLLGMLRRYADRHELCIEFTFGAAALERERDPAAPLEPTQLVELSELCRACRGGGGAKRLMAVQHSVSCQLAIACRQGYAIDGECRLSCAG